MLGTFKSLTAAIKLRVGKVRIDTAVFRLHYRFTFIILVASCLLVTSRQYIGEHIQCIQDVNSNIPAQVINQYCFISATFSVPKFNNNTELSLIGLGPYTEESDEVIFHAYYQWVPFVLFAQAIMFYVPYTLWKAWEGNKVRSIIQGLNVMAVNDNSAGRHRSIDLLANYIYRTLHDHDGWALRLFFCELLNLVNVIGQIFLIDRFLGGEFMRYGINVVQFLELDPENRVDPMATVFPKVTKCNFHKFGPSGTVQRHDAMCILALNIMNEKIYTFLWFWLIILTIITAADALMRLVIVLVPAVRRLILRSRLSGDSKPLVRHIVDRCRIGDYTLIDLLSRNLDPITFGRLAHQLSRLLQSGSSVSSDKNGEDTPILT